MVRRLLILSYFTHEEGMACSHHLDDRLPVFRARGVDCVVLSSWCVRPWQVGKHYRALSLSPSGIRFEVRRRFHTRVQGHWCWKFCRDLLLLPLLPFYGVERMCCRIDPTWYWHAAATRMGVRICRQHHIDTVYSTGGPPVVHAVAADLVRRCGVRWLAEVQDPLIHGYCSGHDDELQKLIQVEKMMYERADRMIFLTRSAMAATEHRVGRTGNGTVIYPGAVRSSGAAQAAGSGPKLRMAHFGSLGGVRNLKTFVAGLEMAMASCPEMEQSVRIELYGNVGRDDLERIDSSGVGALFSCRGLVGRQQALAAMSEVDILLLVQGVHDISRETIPSKCYEYFLTGRLVLGIIYDNEELTAMFDHLGHVAAAAGNSGEIAERLCRLWMSWQQNRLPVPHASPYTVEQAVDRLLSI